MSDSITRFDEELEPDEVEVHGPQGWMIDLSQAPHIYQTNDPRFFGKFMIDFQPETVPSIGPFETEKEAIDHLKKRYSKYFATWFPDFATPGLHRTCNLCHRYVLKSSLKKNFCPECQVKMFVF